MNEQQKENGRTIWKTIGLILSLLFIVVYISVLLSEFEEGVRQEETESVVSAMADLSNQGAEMVEERVTASLRNIGYIAKLLEDEQDIQSEEVMWALNRILSKHNTGVNRFGVATPDGISKISNGDTVDVSDRDFFENSMQGKSFVSESTESKISDKEVFFLSSPIFGKQGEIRGVLYGVIETENYKIYDNEKFTEENRNQYIVDSEGDYISKFMYREAMLNQENLFSDLENMGSQMPIKEIRQHMEENQSTYTEIGPKENRDYVYITPIDINEWYVVTVVDGDSITSKVSHLREHAAQLITQISVIMLLLLMVYFAVMSFEKRKTERMYRELRIRDSIFQVATAEMESFVFLYDAAKDQIDFMNDSMRNLGIPRSIKYASKEMKNYVQEVNRTAIGEFTKKMLHDMQERREKSEYDVVVEQNQATCYYKVKMTNLYDDKNKPVRSIGMIYDITEQKRKQMHLEKTAVYDALTKVYNRSAGTNKINQYLEAMAPGETGAFMILDLDGFKQLNDTLGHMIGDQALAGVADILVKHFRSYDVVCRLGGDEFIIFAKGLPREALDKVLSSLLKKLVLTYTNEGKQVTISASVGVAFAPERGRDFTQLYEKADKALYMIKRSTKNNYRIYDEL